MSCENNGGGSKCICPVSIGLAIGVTYGLFMLMIALASMWFDYGTIVIEQSGAVYIGYAPTVMGAFIGALWGLLHGFVFGLIMGLVYNMISCCCRAKCCMRKTNGCGCGCANCSCNKAEGKR